MDCLPLEAPRMDEGAYRYIRRYCRLDPGIIYPVRVPTIAAPAPCGVIAMHAERGFDTYQVPGFPPG